MQDAINVAKEKGLKSLCFTFSNHPFNFIMNRNEDDPDALKLICSEEYKIKLIEDLGFDILVNVPFDEHMMKMPAQDFFEKIIVNSLNADTVSVGFNYTYGARAVGKADTLYNAGTKAGIDVHVHDAVKVFHEVVSSTLIRNTLSVGNMELVAMYLERAYSFKGVVRYGMKIGKVNGYPTMNIDAPKNILLPPSGVYFSHITIDDIEYKSITNIGTNPTIGNSNEISIETHVFDYNDDAYGKKVIINLDHYHRPEKKFDNKDELYRQIALDCEAAMC